MKKTITLASVSIAMMLLLTACNDKESELDKAIKEGTETSKQMAGTNRPIPVPDLGPDKPQPNKKGGE